MAEETNVTPPAPQPKVISEEDHERMVKEAAKWRLKAKELEDAKKADETKKLTESQQYKELYEKELKEKQSVADELANTRKQNTERQKQSALKDECLKLGLKQESLGDLGIVLDQVQVSDDGAVLNAPAVAERLKQTRPHWFGPAAARPLNTDSVGVVPGQTVSMAMVMDAEAAWKKSQSDVDLQKYRNLLMKFKAENR